jgi:hypothetical protein
MTMEWLSMVAGAVVSVALGYLPGLAGWYGGRSGQEKALINLALVAVIAGSAMAVSCAGLGAEWLALTGVTGPICNQQGAWTLVRMVLAGLMGNTGAYVAIVRPLKAPAGVG